MGDTHPTSPHSISSETLDFESALERLEELVERLEGGDLQLEEALAAFEEGVRLTRHCASRLADAERRIEELVQDGGAWMRRPVDATALGAQGAGGAEPEPGSDSGEGSEWT